MTDSVDGKRGASRTAVMVAALRGRATARPEPVCHDPWAAQLAGADGLVYAAEYDRAFPHVELWIAARTAVIDAEVRGRIAEGFTQIVILGAGLDTRAARIATSGVRFFEVDQPASQADKRARLIQLDAYPLDAATYVSCDFEQQDFLAQLSASGFDVSRAALFVWEGVTYYLPEAAVTATLARIAHGCEARSVVAFDLVRKRFADGEVQDVADVAARDRVAEMGEPLRFGSNDIVPMLFDAGFRKVSAQSFDAIALNLTGTYARDRKFRFQSFVRASVRTALP